MRKEKNIINEISGPERDSSNAAREERLRIEELAGMYFQNRIPPYSENLEERIVNRILSREEKIPLVQTLLFRPALILILFLAFITLSLGIRRMLYEQSVKAKVGEYIALNTPAFDFVASNNMDKIVQAALQKNLGADILDEEEILEKVKSSLWIYLSAQTRDEFISRNREIIMPEINRYSQEYVDYIKENSENILI